MTLSYVDSFTAMELGIEKELWERLGWRRFSSSTMPEGELTKLGFSKTCEKMARRGGCLLLPLWWLEDGEVKITGHRVRHLDASLEDQKYHFPVGAQGVHGAYGRLLEGPEAWGDASVPLLLFEGEKKAACLAGLLPEYAIVSSPGMWQNAAARSDGEKASKFPKRAHAELTALELRRRRVVVMGDRDAVDGSNPKVRAAFDDTCLRLAQRGAEVFELFPPSEKGWDDWVLARRERVGAGGWREAVREEVLAAVAGAPAWIPPPGVEVAPAPAHGMGQPVASALGPYYTGPAGLVVPPGYAIQDAAGAPLARVSPDGNLERLCSGAMWVESIGHMPDGSQHVNAAAVVDGEVKQISFPRSLLGNDRALLGFLCGRGVSLQVAKKEDVCQYFHDFFDANRRRIPSFRYQRASGWTEDMGSFLFGRECLGRPGHALFEDGKNEAMEGILGAFGRAGSASLWKSWAEALVAASPAAALALAAACSSPLLEPGGMAPVAVLFGELGGSGKSVILRLCGSAFGQTGRKADRQPGGVVGQASGTKAGMLHQFVSVCGLPRLGDEVKAVEDERKNADIADVLQQISEGRLHVRANRESTGARAGKPALASTVIAGELPAEELLSRQGQLRRFLTPKAPSGGSFFAPGIDFGAAVAALSENYGHLGRGLVEALLKGGASAREEIARAYAAACEMLKPKSGGQVAVTWSQQIAACLATVETCAKLCPELCPDPRAWTKQILAQWRSLHDEGDAEEGRDASEAGDLAERMWAQMITWLTAHFHAILPSHDYRRSMTARGDGGGVRAANTYVGYVVKAEFEGTPEVELHVVDVSPEQLRDCLGRHVKSVLGVWHAQGRLHCPSSSVGSRWTVVARHNGMTGRFYRIILNKDLLRHKTQNPGT